jgi:hypothetical protein
LRNARPGALVELIGIGRQRDKTPLSQPRKGARVGFRGSKVRTRRRKRGNRNTGGIGGLKTVKISRTERGRTGAAKARGVIKHTPRHPEAPSPSPLPPGLALRAVARSPSPILLRPSAGTFLVAERKRRFEVLNKRDPLMSAAYSPIIPSRPMESHASTTSSISIDEDEEEEIVDEEEMEEDKEEEEEEEDEEEEVEEVEEEEEEEEEEGEEQEEEEEEVEEEIKRIEKEEDGRGVNSGKSSNSNRELRNAPVHELLDRIYDLQVAISDLDNNSSNNNNNSDSSDSGGSDNNTEATGSVAVDSMKRREAHGAEMKEIQAEMTRRLEEAATQQVLGE